MKFSVFSMICVSLGMTSAYSVSDSNQVSGNEQSGNNSNRLAVRRYRPGPQMGRPQMGGSQMGGPQMKLQIFSQTGHRGSNQVQYLTSGRCYNIPSTGSAIYDDGTRGSGYITFCAGSNCQGGCYTASRSVQLYPNNIPGIDLGAYANSVMWSL
ncbi:hypothetical protein AX774_g5251 [Zancudomyces culisetae]|uniref:Uncharacterized protein n=1 Tax=Zancudomyces culisetae TaxID=1213189 RepID=A0A1R1PK39_ZANCU|nr:hypothetical protein AX774_g5251 [Zancudomyces culisetae]|eukprot:OMH81307.1 hypothetical protein AX774_g5251 [Zancudomyces culisetae]